MFDIGLLYAIVAGVAVFVVLLIHNRANATEREELIDKPLNVLLVFLAAFCSADMIWGILSSSMFETNRLMYIISSYSFHLGAAFSAFVWAGYVINYVGVSGRNKITLNILRGIFIVMQMAVLISNIWTGWFFVVNEDCVYEAYDMRDFMFFMQFAYYVVIIVFCLLRLSDSSQKGKRRKYASALFFSFVPLVFGIGQMFWPDAPLYSLGFMVTALLIYLYNVTYQREEFSKELWRKENNKLSGIVEGLADDFLVIGYVNVETGEYEVVSNSIEYEALKDTDSERKNFFTDGMDKFRTFIYEEDFPMLEKMLSKEHIVEELSSKKSFRFNVRIAMRDGIRYYMIKVIEMKNSEGVREFIVGLFDDDDRIREEVRQKEALSSAIKEAQRANRAKTDFLFNMSHDIRTPMNAILGFNELASRHIDDKKYLEECLGKVHRSGEHLLALINDVLDMSRIESNKLTLNSKTESIIESTKSIIEITQSLASAKSVTYVHSNRNITNEFVECDSLRINQILLNILSNAVKYTGPGGSVESIFEQVSEDDENVRFRFTVKDTGIGISEEFVGKIFNEFEREQSATASGVEGTGLGMSIVKRIAELMGGDIKIASIKDVGTTVVFTVSLKKSSESFAEKTDEVQEATVLVEGNFRILLVDDNELNREIGEDILSEAGLTVETAVNGKEALDAVVNHEVGYYDAILMDVQMPYMDGYTATREIRAYEEGKGIHVPIIAMTANAFEEDRQNALNSGMDEHLSKPMDTTKVVVTLNRFFSKSCS
ncbi:MAG: ATP-binding protein [Lachnospiraceae bacterium]|nr:ATP-binding protein [Lachnospiraceae bacterium]